MRTIRRKQKKGFTTLETGTDDPSSHGVERDSEHQCRLRKGIFLSLTGFTLGEMVTTVAIIGTISSIAIPNYIRLRDDTNFQMVKQHMRVIGEKMVEIMGKKGQFPEQDRWPGELNQDEDELALTANLAGLRDKCYTDNEYWTDLYSYKFRSCPRRSDPKCRRVNTPCVIVHTSSDPLLAYIAPAMVGELELTDARGITVPLWGDFLVGGQGANFWHDPSLTHTILSDASSSTAEKVDYLTAQFEQMALFQDALNWEEVSGLPKDPPNSSLYSYSQLMLLSRSDQSFFNQLMLQVADKLLDKGIQFYYAERSRDYAYDGLYWPGQVWIFDEMVEAVPQTKFFEVAFQVQNRAESLMEAQTRSLDAADVIRSHFSLSSDTMTYTTNSDYVTSVN